MSDGAFALVTNRSYLSEVSVKVLRSPEFVAELSRFLNACKDKEPIFGDILKRLQNDRAEKELDVQIKLQREMKSSVSARRRFKILDQELLKGHWFVEPSFGQEHGVGAAYTMFSHFVPPDSPMRAYWRRPLTFSGRGIDSIVQPYGVTSLESEKLESVEYKYKFALTGLFNHPPASRYRVLAPDSRGHGQTSNPTEGLGYDQVADDVAAFIAALGLKQPVLAG